MVDEASFTRVETERGAEFRVIPAPVVGGIAFLTGAGCGTALASFAVFFVGVALLIALLFNGFGAFLTIATYTAPVWAIAGFVLWARRKQFHKAAGPRDPVTVIVNPEGITANGKHYPRADIAELVMRHPRDHGGYKDETITLSDDASFQVGRAIGMKRALKAANTSFELMIRTKSSSTFETLVYGLTPTVGEALHRDISAAMS